MRCVAALLLTALCAFGQKLEFEVASVKPTASIELSGLSVDMGGGRFVARNISLLHLIETAFELNELQVPDVPGWIKSARFDIQAQAAGTVTDAQTRQMLQALLEDRFQLKFHRTTREQSAYALNVDERGLKLRPSGEAPANGTLRLGNVDTPSITMKTLISMLEFELGRRVVDRTNVTTNFALRLEWASQKIPSDADSGKPSLTTALRELGLKLESTKAPLEVFVIDRIEQPSEN